MTLFNYRLISQSSSAVTPENISWPLSKNVLRIDSAREKGLSEKGTVRLRNILKRSVSVFGIKLRKNTPAKIRSFEEELKDGAKLARASQRRYGPIQQKLIEETIKNLENIGALYRNPNAKWARPALEMPKPGADQLRFICRLKACERDDDDHAEQHDTSGIPLAAV